MKNKLGRKQSADKRDRNYLIKDKLSLRGTKPTFKYWDANGWWGDQGDTPQCVGYSWAHWLEDGPVPQNGIAPIVPPSVIYSEAQKLDVFPGEDYDGTTVRAAAKYLQNRGFVTNYYWAFDLNTLIDTLLLHGPVVVGTYWYENMFYPNPSSGILSATGQVAGGHAYLVNGVDVRRRLFRIKNSWGKSWGKGGHAFITFKDMTKLIKFGGEICLATEKTL